MKRAAESSLPTPAPRGVSRWQGCRDLPSIPGYRGKSSGLRRSKGGAGPSQIYSWFIISDTSLDVLLSDGLDPVQSFGPLDIPRASS
jgi:hypothetical protein